MFEHQLPELVKGFLSMGSNRHSGRGWGFSSQRESMGKASQVLARSWELGSFDGKCWKDTVRALTTSSAGTYGRINYLGGEDLRIVVLHG